MADTLTKAVAFRLPVEIYFKCLTEASEKKMTIAEYISSHFFHSWSNNSKISAPASAIKPAMGKDEKGQQPKTSSTLDALKLKESIYNQKLKSI